eukprot:c5588_g2_i1 orf=59-883(+)
MEQGMKSKVLIIGGTGYVGRHIANASLAQGHPTFLLVRPDPSANPDRSVLLQSFQSKRATLLHGSLEDFESLVEAIRQVDVVISAIGHNGYSHTGMQLADQIQIIKAIQKVGGIKRFVPSEFGVDVTRPNLHPLMKTTLIDKLHIRNAIEEASIPYTYVSANNLFIPFLNHTISNSPTKLTIYGDGNTKAIYVAEEDVGTYTIQAIDDPRTLNKTMYIRPPSNILTQKDLLVLWKEKLCETIDVNYITTQELQENFEGCSHQEKVFIAFVESVF